MRLQRAIPLVSLTAIVDITAASLLNLDKPSATVKFDPEYYFTANIDFWKDAKKNDGDHDTTSSAQSTLKSSIVSSAQSTLKSSIVSSAQSTLKASFLSSVAAGPQPQPVVPTAKQQPVSSSPQKAVTTDGNVRASPAASSDLKSPAETQAATTEVKQAKPGIVQPDSTKTVHSTVEHTQIESTVVETVYVTDVNAPAVTEVPHAEDAPVEPHAGDARMMPHAEDAPVVSHAENSPVVPPAEDTPTVTVSVTTTVKLSTPVVVKSMETVVVYQTKRVTVPNVKVYRTIQVRVTK